MVYASTMEFPEDVTRDVMNRLRRAEGQLRGVQRPRRGRRLQGGRDPAERRSGGPARTGLRLMSAGMRYCLTDPGRAQAEGMTADGLEELFLALP